MRAWSRGCAGLSAIRSSGNSKSNRLTSMAEVRNQKMETGTTVRLYRHSPAPLK
jgi:hypothetical protein